MTSSAQLLKTPAELRHWAHEQKLSGRRIALVPTMGALHEGHVALVRKASEVADAVAVSIFVNPTQFGPKEDFAHYPRTLDTDLEKLAPFPVDAVFHPQPEAIYPSHFDTYVVPDTMAKELCGATRPGHFRGVCTVVLLLFRMSLCDVAIFGRKDYQQLQIIRRMVRDLWLDVDIVDVPTVRDADGLAKSSRNQYLTPEQRSHALKIPQALQAVANAYAKKPEQSARGLMQIAHDVLRGSSLLTPEYVALVHGETLQPLGGPIEGPAVCAIAARLGNTRLIDNCDLSPHP